MAPTEIYATAASPPMEPMIYRPLHSRALASSACKNLSGPPDGKSRQNAENNYRRGAHRMDTGDVQVQDQRRDTGAER
jgi:hypothetical protein